MIKKTNESIKKKNPMFDYKLGVIKLQTIGKFHMCLTAIYMNTVEN